MTLQEAIKSGRPFRRKFADGCVSDYFVIGRNGEMFREYIMDRIPISSNDVLANDWELKPEESLEPREFWIFQMPEPNVIPSNHREVDNYAVEFYNGEEEPSEEETGCIWYHVIEQLPGYKMIKEEEIKKSLTTIFSKAMKEGYKMNGAGDMWEPDYRMVDKELQRLGFKE